MVSDNKMLELVDSICIRLGLIFFGNNSFICEFSN